MQNPQQTIIQLIFTIVGAHGMRLELRRFCLIFVMPCVCCDAVHAVAYRAYAIRPYIYTVTDYHIFASFGNWRKTIIAHSFPNTPKTTSDVEKTMSYVGKIISDIIQTTSDLFSLTCNTLITIKL